MNPKRFNPILIAAFALFVMALMAFAFYKFRSGIQVTVTNTGSTSMHSVELQVTGRTYTLGDIRAGGSAATTVKPTDKSHLQIDFIDDKGQPHQLDAGGNLESGYVGTIRVSIKDGVIEHNEQEVL